MSRIAAVTSALPPHRHRQADLAAATADLCALPPGRRALLDRIFTDPLQWQSLVIYNLLGQEIERISLEKSSGNSTKMVWKNAAKQPAGTYLAKLFSEGNCVQTLKFTKLQ